ncbi:MAG: VWA domain-containing protein, partial [Amaricoccus sp.]
MYPRLFAELRAAKLPVSLREYLGFLEALDAGLAEYDAEGFYYLARASLVKDERLIDRFDQVFGTVFGGLETITVTT